MTHTYQLLLHQASVFLIEPKALRRGNRQQQPFLITRCVGSNETRKHAAITSTRTTYMLC